MISLQQRWLGNDTKQYIIEKKCTIIAAVNPTQLEAQVELLLARKHVKEAWCHASPMLKQLRLVPYYSLEPKIYVNQFLEKIFKYFLDFTLLSMQSKK